MIFASVDASILQLLCWVTDARQQATHCKQHLEQALRDLLPRYGGDN
jgi:hypothetical protein